MDESFTIQISSSLVSKLARDADKPKQKAKKPKSKIPKETPKPRTETKSASSVPSSGSNGGWPLQSSIFLPITPTPPPPPPPVAIAELETIRSVLKESEEVVKRLEKQEADMVQELTQRAKELRDKEFKLPYQKSNPCLAEKEACLQCYKEQQQSKQPLKCAQVVKSFEDCAREARQHRQVGPTSV